jgi:hypothetical protein
MSSTNSFIKDKLIGQFGEYIMLKCCPEGTLKLSGRGADLRLPSGVEIEVKTSTSDNNQQIFFSYNKDDRNVKPCGPWKALNNGVMLYAQLFIKSGTLYLYDTKKLVDKLDAIWSTKNTVSIQNKWSDSSYNTTGSWVDVIEIKGALTNEALHGISSNQELTELRNFFASTRE